MAKVALWFGFAHHDIICAEGKSEKIKDKLKTHVMVSEAEPLTTKSKRQNSTMPISFQSINIKLPPLQKAALKTFMSTQTMKEVKKKLHITYVFCSDEYLLNMNKQFLGHDYYTDIITFPLAETEKEIEAEIYISVDRVKDNAAKFKTDFNDEFHRVIFHGVLHLMGYKDKTKADKETMRAKENEWISKFKRALKAS